MYELRVTVAYESRVIIEEITGLLQLVTSKVCLLRIKLTNNLTRTRNYKQIVCLYNASRVELHSLPKTEDSHPLQNEFIHNYYGQFLDHI